MNSKRSTGLPLFALGRVAVIGLALTALGCPGGDDSTTTVGMDGSSTSTTNTTPGTTIDPDTTGDGTGTGSATGTGSDSGTSSPGTSSSGDSGTTGDGSGTDTGDSGDSGTTTGGVELCEVMLPPPGMCTNPGDGFPGTANLVCDPIAQTGCAAGEKCMPWANDGGTSWNATRCSPLNPMPNQVGDPCTVEGSGVSGIDDCDAGMMCWDVDPMTNMGTCIELCGCSYDSPSCQTPNQTCSISNNAALTICTDVCNPLDPMACDAGQGCYPVGELFQCAPDASGAGGAEGDPCAFINVCDPGLVCLAAAAVPGCAGGVGCCASTCSIDDPAPGCPVGSSCVAWYEGGAAPDMCLGTVGVCAAP
ncbi:MAG: hypothetical protein H6712_17385 [Myxococcales bacterium]|nr:hypothetical protein [Myxococcales bacterium]MCB9715646.1 hypothetical protein [Myxococcales bacterium]